MKLFLSLLPIAAFYIAYKCGGIYWATGAIMFTYSLEAIGYRIVDGSWSKTKVYTAIAVICLGSVAIGFQSEEVIKWKVTIVSFLIAFTLIISKYVFNVDLLKKVLASNGTEVESLAVSDKTFKVIVVWQFVVGLVNLWVFKTQSTEAWVDFKTFGLPAISLVFLLYCIWLVVSIGGARPRSEERGD